MLREMVEKLEKDIEESKFVELMNKHFAANAIPKGIHCLSLYLTNEYPSNAHARGQLLLRNYFLYSLTTLTIT